MFIDGGSNGGLQNEWWGLQKVTLSLSEDYLYMHDINRNSIFKIYRVVILNIDNLTWNMPRNLTPIIAYLIQLKWVKY